MDPQKLSVFRKWQGIKHLARASKPLRSGRCDPVYLTSLELAPMIGESRCAVEPKGRVSVGLGFQVTLSIWDIGEPLQNTAMTANEHKDTFARALTAQLPALRRYAIVLVGHKAAADDLVQDCIERALRQSVKLEHVERIGGWLRSILHNLHIDEQRRKRRQGFSVDLDDVANNASVATTDRDTATVLDFDRAMQSLSFEHRQILLLVGLEGLNYRQVADELDIPVGTVMSRLARARERLRHAMEFPAVLDTKT
jgi:RNA polymerase sigma-70 factor (ECF subfamily)